MKEPVQMPLQASACEIEKITLPQIVSIKQASEIMNLPPYYLRRVCRENPDLAFQSGVKWYINLGKLAAYYNNKTEQCKGDIRKLRPRRGNGGMRIRSTVQPPRSMRSMEGSSCNKPVSVIRAA